MNAPARSAGAGMNPVVPGTDLRQYRDNPLKRGQQKYHNEKVTTADGLKFDSKAEHKRWIYLAWMGKAKEITDLQRQVVFELIPAQERPSGGRERACSYIADFTYRNKDGTLVCEDVKGAMTPEYRIKRKLLLLRHGLEIQEIRA